VVDDVIAHCQGGSRHGVVAGAGLLLITVVAADPVAQASDRGAAAGEAVPSVRVARVVEQSVPLERTYIGTTAAAKSVDLRAQVTGYLVERPFMEGSVVGEGAALFIIDPRPFQAIVDQKQAQLKEQLAVLKYATLDLDRYAALAKVGAAAQERLDQAVELQKKTEAAIDVYKAELEQAKFNLQMTEIKAPFDGRVGRTFVNIGSLIKANETQLASFVQVDPLYVYFSPPETDLPLIEAHQAESPLQVTITLPRVQSEPLIGRLTFISNAADANTGTIAMRATLTSPPETIRPGQFTRVHLRLADDAKVLVVPSEAVATTQGQAYVMVVDDDDRVTRRNVRLGRQALDRGRVVEAGLHSGERVVVSEGQILKTGERVMVQAAPEK
jgi:multidrug efflux system membrane fusion protein